MLIDFYDIRAIRMKCYNGIFFEIFYIFNVDVSMIFIY